MLHRIGTCDEPMPLILKEEEEEEDDMHGGRRRQPDR